MLLTIITGKRKRATTDSYKNIINEFEHKDETCVIIPSIYKPDDFSDEFKLVLRETFSYHHKVLALFLGLLFAVKIRRIVKSNSVKRIFLYFDNDWINIYLMLLLVGTKVDYYTWVHDPELHSGEGYINTTVRAFNKKFLYKRAKKIFVSWEGAKDIISALYKVKPQSVIPIKLPEMAETEFHDIKPLPFDECVYDIIFFGRIEKYKGIDLLVDTIFEMEQAQKTLKVLIAGTGKAEQQVAEKTAGHNGITFMNEYIPDRKLAELIAVSKIVVLPYTDATGTQTIQLANFYNRPVIASKKGCFPEYITNGINGLIFDNYTPDSFSEQISKLLENPSLYNEMQQKIPSYFKKNFNLQSMAHRLESELRG